MKFKGSKLKLLLNKHPYADAMIADLDNFKKMTGMDVSYDVFPEDVYFDKVTAALSSSSSEYDAFMTGAFAAQVARASRRGLQAGGLPQTRCRPVERRDPYAAAVVIVEGI